MIPLHLLQLADSAFPTGGFAHASGLEAARELGLVESAEDVRSWAREILWNTSLLALPFVAAAHREPGKLADIDGRCDAAIASHVAKRASRAQGAALLRTAAAAFPAAAAVAEAARAQRLACHHAPVHGAVLSLLGADVASARRLFLFGALRGVVAAAVRLGLVGPLEAQALQAGLAPDAEEALAAGEGLAVKDAAAASPLLDLVQGHQDRLYSKLFQS